MGLPWCRGPRERRAGPHGGEEQAAGFAGEGIAIRDGRARAVVFLISRSAFPAVDLGLKLR